ncbi:10322_t:CDS:2 [Cetraspora pellucida]|uniref:10322_t:CDS:1 n=1 Tax=Cetraspora pellucida TaxID=1433469 RepID=A0ACA9JW35_9GLOM|nr:10322_t:CDS:2 [Cetraspora pellucida]
MGRTPAYSKQAQQCPVCNKQYAFIKWCKACDSEQFQKQFSSWETGLSIWDYVLGRRIQYSNTPVALKELNKSANMSKNFLNEVIAYIKSFSSTVLQCYGISRNSNYKEYIMSLNWVNKLDILRHILFGLSDIHASGLVHRDLHPGNLLHYRRTITMSDLGLCRPTYDINESEEIHGVIPFMTPEVLNREPYTQY